MLHGKPSAVAKWRPLSEGGMILLGLMASGEQSGKRAVKVGNTITFCQISQFFHGCLLGFVRSGVKPSQVFPEQLHEPDLERKVLPFEFRHKPLVMTLSWVALSQSLVSQELSFLICKGTSPVFPNTCSCYRVTWSVYLNWNITHSIYEIHTHTHTR